MGEILSEELHKPRYQMRLSPLAFLLVLATTAAKGQESLMLGFTAKNTEQFKLRYSSDGISWRDGDGGSGAAGMSVSGASDDAGVTRVLSWTSPTQIKFLTCLGAICDNTRTDDINRTTKSGATAAFARNAQTGMWIFAFKTGDGHIAMPVYSVKDHRFVLSDVSPQGAGASNSEVRAQPTLAYTNTTIGLAWNRSNGEVRTAAGSIGSFGAPEFTKFAKLPIPVKDEGGCYGGTASVYPPMMTSNGAKFYVAVSTSTINCTRSQNFLSRMILFVFQSDDAVTWTLHSKLGPSSLEIAGFAMLSNGTGIIVSGGPSPEVRRFDGTNWLGASLGSVFGVTPKNLGIALFRAAAVR